MVVKDLEPRDVMKSFLTSSLYNVSCLSLPLCLVILVSIQAVVPLCLHPVVEVELGKVNAVTDITSKKNQLEHTELIGTKLSRCLTEVTNINVEHRKLISLSCQLVPLIRTLIGTDSVPIRVSRCDIEIHVLVCVPNHFSG